MSFYIHESCLGERMERNPIGLIELEHPVATTLVVVAVVRLQRVSRGCKRIMGRIVDHRI